MANIAGREHPGNACLQVIRLTIEWPVGGPLPRMKQVGARDQITRIIAHNAYFFGPVRVRLAADANEQPVSAGVALRTGVPMLECNFLQAMLAVQDRDVRPRKHFDIRSGEDAIDQVLRESAF